MSRGRTCGADLRGHAAPRRVDEDAEDAEDAEEAEGVAPARLDSLASPASKLPFLGVTASCLAARVTRVPYPSRTRTKVSVSSILESCLLFSSSLHSLKQRDAVPSPVINLFSFIIFFVNSNGLYDRGSKFYRCLECRDARRPRLLMLNASGECGSPVFTSVRDVSFTSLCNAFITIVLLFVTRVKSFYLAVHCIPILFISICLRSLIFIKNFFSFC